MGWVLWSVLGMSVAFRVFKLVMFDASTYFSEWKSKTKPPETRALPRAPLAPNAAPRQEQAGFAKVFRWPVPAGQTPPPTTVEVVGSFSNWQKVPLAYDKVTQTWQATVANIEGNRTHRYVVLVDGKPSYDKNCDGLTAPQGPDEVKWQLETPRGPRVLLLFAQTK